MAVSKRLRFEILRRDDHCCRYCGEHASPQVKLTIDHVLPVALGGNDDPTNLVAACAPCNSGKTSTSPGAPLVAQVADDALRYARAIDLAYKGRVYDLHEQAQYSEFICDHWFGSHNLGQHRQPPVPDDWEQSIDTFYRRGLPLDLLTKAASTALNNTRVTRYDKWRYFMGIAWSMVTETEEHAKRIFDLDTEGVLNGP